MDQSQNPVSGVTVTFTAPRTGASGVFSDSNTYTTTATTNGAGIATAASFSANSISGTYSVTATPEGASNFASFTLTNWPTGSQYYAFFLSGQEDYDTGFVSGLYSLAGSVVIDANGNVLGGEQDYNDGSQKTSPEPSGDLINGGSLKTNDTTHTGTLVLNTNNLNLGVGGVETFAVQYVNSSHALITQYDGTGTSSGSLDLQRLPDPGFTNLSGGYAFTLAGMDPYLGPVSYGGVFSIATSNGITNLQSGIADTNDYTLGAVTTGTAFSGALSLPDQFGRGLITSTLNYDAIVGSASPIALNYYIVGPEVMRIVDVDATDFAIGSAYGQGTNAGAASNASIGTSIFGIAGNNPTTDQYAAAGMFTTNPGNGTFSGVGDDSELSFFNVISAASITGTYGIADNGYGNLTIASGQLGSVSVMGVYVTDPNLNLLDPNNRSTGVGGALLVDLDQATIGGVGFLLPQTNTSAVSFTGQYSVSAQDENFFSGSAEFDFVGTPTVTSGAMSGTGELSDPFLTLNEAPINSIKITGTPLPDSSNPGRYTLSTNNTPANPLVITIKSVPFPFNVVMYQASGDQLLWLDEDIGVSVFFGTLQQEGSF